MKKLADYSLTLRSKEYVPLMQGGMGVDISSSELALAVARHGAIGHISDAMSPYVADRKFKTKYQHSKLLKYRGEFDGQPVAKIEWDPKEVYSAQIKHIESTMNQKRGDGLVFVNVMEKLAMGAPKETLKARLEGAMDGGIDGITLSAGLHNGTLSLVQDHPRFHDVIFGIIVSSARALNIFLRGAARVNRYPDYIVVEGPLAGGHLGFGEDWKEHSLRDIHLEVMALLRENNLQIPVIPAGGIFSGGDAVELFKLGASAVQVATRFTITKECGLPENVKYIYLNAKEDDIEVNLTSPTGYPMRMLKSSPSLRSNIKPNCESLGYILDGKGHCQYREAWYAAPVNENGEKPVMSGKMCICHHFMTFQCYTCGHNVYRLKDTIESAPDGKYHLPDAEAVLKDYLYNEVPVPISAVPSECDDSALTVAAGR